MHKPVVSWGRNVRLSVSATHPPTHLHLSGNAHLRELLALLQRLAALALRLSVEQPAIAGMYGVWAEEKQ